jgi:uncharacterized protein (DUF697 family)
MNQSLLLHIVERLEGFLRKLPGTIQQPILRELTPLKELFLQQRPPRFVLLGSNKLPAHEIIRSMFEFSAGGEPIMANPTEIYFWEDVSVAHGGKAELLDARAADDRAMGHVTEELRRQPADMFFFLCDEQSSEINRREIDNLAAFLATNDAARVVVLRLAAAGSANSRRHSETVRSAGDSAVPAALSDRPIIRDRLVRSGIVHIARGGADSNVSRTGETSLASLLVRELPNAARVEMIRISRDRAAQLAVADVLVKSTSAICAAVGAQPIPLADLPILTTLQLVMVSGIMYIGGRERSMRAATEFMAALGANVGAGMILREGTRALLKFVPGWGNVVCGMVAGAGTYGIGRAATAYFLEGGSLSEARKIFRLRRKNAKTDSFSQPSAGETVHATDGQR